jgi:hypothetical protein
VPSARLLSDLFTQAALVILKETIAAEDAHRAERDARKGEKVQEASVSGGFH